MLKPNIHFIQNVNQLQKVAIIVPVYNVENYLRQCLDSIRNQTYQNFIVITVDDGSTDTSSIILNEYKNKDSRFCLITQNNQGAPSARNLALDFLAKEQNIEFVHFLDADDYIAKEFLECAIKNLSETNSDYFVCGYEIFDQTGIQTNIDSSPKVYRLNQDQIGNHYFKEPRTDRGHRDKTVGRFLNNKVFRLKNIENIRFNQNLYCIEDVDFFLQCLPRIKKGVLIPTPLFFYRLRKSSLSHTLLFNEYKLSFFAQLYLKRKYLPCTKSGIEKCLLDSLWGVTQYVYTGKNNQYTKESIKLLYDDLCKTNIFDDATPQNKRRFFLFKLGSKFLRIYFLIKERTKRKNTQLSYFP